MEGKKAITCCVIGHRRVEVTDELRRYLKMTMLKLIANDGVDTFLFGNKGDFDKLCYEAISEIREVYPNVKRVYVRAEFQEISNSYEKYLLTRYEYTCYPVKIAKAGRAVYVERNYEMIEKSDYAIFYFDEAYTVKSGRYPSKSGTRLAYEFAMKKDVEIYNVANKQAF